MKELVQKMKDGEQISMISNEHMEKYTELLNGLNAGNLLVEAKATVISEEINAA